MNSFSRERRRRVGLFCLTATLLLLSSCTSRLGWGLLLWSAPQAGLHAGTVVPVYIRSNIEKLYVVGVPGTTKKIEVPLWQIDLFRSKAAAEKSVAAFGDKLTSYLFANRDGLPIRDTPTNAGKRVYRLREGQSVKILAPAKGDVVTTGAEVLEGAWYQVVTEDGTRGYVFSNTMRLYDELVEAPPSIAGTSDADPARRVDLVFSRIWRAEYFQTMIDEGRVDLDSVSPRFGLFADAVRRQIRIELPTVSQVFNYASIAQSDGDIVFEGSPLRIRIDGDRRLVADWSGLAAGSGLANGGTVVAAAQPASAPPTLAAARPGTSPAAPAASAGSTAGSPAAGLGSAAASLTSAQPGSPGAPVDPQVPDAGLLPLASATQAVFVVLGTDLRDAIRAEETRRLNLLSRFLDSGADWSFKPSALPASPGSVDAAASAPEGLSRFTISRGGRFLWTAIDLVPPSYLPTDLGTLDGGRASGEATVRLSLDPAIAGSWEGALSLRFDGTKNWLDLLWRHEGSSLLLLPVAAGGVRDLTAYSASALDPLSFAAAN